MLGGVTDQPVGLNDVVVNAGATVALVFFANRYSMKLPSVPVAPANATTFQYVAFVGRNPLEGVSLVNMYVDPL